MFSPGFRGALPSKKSLSPSFLPLPLEALDVFLDERLAELDLDEGEVLGSGAKGVLVAHRNVEHVAAAHSAALAVEHEFTLALGYGPDLAAVVVELVAYALACLEGEALGEGLGAVGVGAHVDHTICAPAPLFVHRPVAYALDQVLEPVAPVLGAYQYAAGAQRHDRVLETLADEGSVELIDDVDVLVVAAHHHLALAHGRELFAEGVPGAEVLPLPGVRHEGDGRGLLHNFVVEADLREFRVALAQLAEAACRDVFVDKLPYVAETECEHASVPHRAHLQELGCPGGIRLLGESLHLAPEAVLAVAGRDYIAELLAWAARLNAHQDYVGRALFHRLRHPGYGVEVAALGIDVARHHHHHLVVSALLLLGEVGAGQGDSREGVPALGLGDYAYVVAYLVDYAFPLGCAGGEGEGVCYAGLPNLAGDTLYHGFTAAVWSLKYAEELLASRVVAERPEPLSGTTGEKNELHIG